MILFVCLCMCVCQITELLTDVERLKQALNGLSQLAYTSNAPHKRQTQHIDTLQAQIKSLQQQLAVSEHTLHIQICITVIYANICIFHYRLFATLHSGMILPLCLFVILKTLFFVSFSACFSR